MLALSITMPVSATEWVEVSKSDYSSTYIDETSITKDQDGLVHYFAKIEYARAIEKPFVYTSNEGGIIANCLQGARAIRQSTYFNGQDVAYVSKVAGDFETPQGAGLDLLNYACNKENSKSKANVIIPSLLITAGVLLFGIGIIYSVYVFGHDEKALSNLASNRDIKRTARHALSGKWGSAALVVLVYLPFYLLQAVPYVGYVIMLLIGGAFALGWSAYALKLVRHDDAGIGDLFAGFNEFGRSLGAYLLMSIYIFLWTLLLIIPGILAGLSYAMTFYILADHPEIKINDAIGLSRKLMEGRRWKYFCLMWNFFGWFILVVLTFGIAIFWVLPYLMATIASFYEDIKREDQLGIEKATANTKNASSKSVNANNNNEAAPAPIKTSAENKATSIEKNDETIDLARYKQAAEEIETGNRDDALWYKAFADKGGEENATKAAYIRLRVEQLRRETVVPAAVKVTSTHAAQTTLTKTLYGVLGIARNASNEQILAGYQKQTAIIESQINQDAETKKRLWTILHAKVVLLDPVKRADYDAKI